MVGQYIIKITGLFFIVSLASCDYSVYVAVRNYKAPCRVNVTFQNSGNTFLDNDTLLLKPINNPKFDSSLLRVNTSASTYYFIAPREKEIALRPMTLGVSIRQVEIINSPDSLWSINFGDRKQFKELKKSGQIKTKGLIFTTSIYIENK